MIATLRQRNFALLWLGGMISQTGDWLLIIGLPIYVYVQTGSALATGIMLITAYVPNLLFGSIAGVFVDRWDRRRTMIICSLLMALGLLPLLLVHDQGSLWIVYIVLFFESSLEQLVIPAENALLPNLVSEEQLVQANSLKSISSNLARLIGAALGGLVIGLLGLRGTTLLDALSFLFVCFMVYLITMPRREAEEEKTSKPTITASLQQLGRDWLEGLHQIYRRHALTILFAMIAVQSLGEGVFGVLLVVFVKKVLGGNAILYGSLLSIQALGSLIGGAFIGQIGSRFSSSRLLGICTCIFGIIDLMIINIPLFIHSSVPVLLLFFLVGIPGVGGIVAFNSLLQTLVEDKLRGRIFGALLTIEALLVLVGMGLAGILGDKLGPVLLLNIQGSVYTLSGILALATLPRLIQRRQKVVTLTSEKL